MRFQERRAHGTKVPRCAAGDASRIDPAIALE